MYGVSKISSEQNIMLTTFPGAQYSAQSLAEHLDVFAKAGIVVDMICQSAPRGSAVDFSFTTSYDNFAAVMKALPAAAKANPPLVSGGYSKINLFGEEMVTSCGVAARALAALAGAGIEIVLITTSDLDISLLIRQQDEDTALNALIGAMDRQGYLTPSAQVNIFVDGKDDDYNRQLYQQVTDSFSHLLPSQAPQEETKEQEDTPQMLSEEQVKQICLSHAGVQAAQASFQSISLQQGEQPVYQLLFTAAGSSYIYRIDPYSGQVLSYERTEETAAQPNTPAASAPTQPQAEPKSVSLEQAKQLALQKAGLSGQTVTWEKAELDEEDGISYYELEFTFSQSEYECEVDAVSGSILKFEQD